MALAGEFDPYNDDPGVVFEGFVEPADSNFEDDAGGGPQGGGVGPDGYGAAGRADDDDDGGGAEQAVSVVVRVRPFLADEAEDDPAVGGGAGSGGPARLAVQMVGTNKLRVVAKEGTPFENVLECAYDKVLGSECGQRDVFETTTIKPAVLGVAHGISCCVFA